MNAIRDGSRVVVAVADGHGSRDSFRSHLGARFGAEIAVTEASAVLDGLAEAPTTDELAMHVRGLSRNVAGAWSARVLEHLRENRVADEDLAASPRGRKGHESDPLRAYGATLLIAMVTEESALLLQLGDGDIVVVAESGTAFEPVPGDELLVAGETTSLCLPEAHRFVRWATLDLRTNPFQLLLLATDGYGNSFADSTWRQDVAEDMARHLAGHGLDWIEQHLPEWLAESAEVAGDDVTVAMVAIDGSETAP